MMEIRLQMWGMGSWGAHAQKLPFPLSCQKSESQDSGFRRVVKAWNSLYRSGGGTSAGLTGVLRSTWGSMTTNLTTACASCVMLGSLCTGTGNVNPGSTHGFSSNFIPCHTNSSLNSSDDMLWQRLLSDLLCSFSLLTVLKAFLSKDYIFKLPL